jgi:hypothetical protein
MFYPSRGANLVVSAGAASASVAIKADENAVRLVNSGTKICYVRIGEGAQVASVADIPVLSGETVIIGKASGSDTLAYISADSTTLNIQPGQEAD